MVQIFRAGKGGPGKKRTGAGKQRQAGAGKKREVRIDHLEHEAKGVVPGTPITFVTGALPGETCVIREQQRQKHIVKATVEEVQRASEHRISPFCPHFSDCGGCQTQYAAPHYLLVEKQQAIARLLQKLSALPVEQQPWQAPLTGKQKGYRRKLRLAIDARDSSQIKIGFRGDANRVINISECQVAEPALQNLLAPLRSVLESLDAVKQLGHAILFVGSAETLAEDSEQVYITLRIIRRLPANDREKLHRFAAQQQCTVILDHGQQHYEALQNGETTVSYQLQLAEQSALQLRLGPDDFVQVNHQLNQMMVQQALDWLAPKAEDKILDLFCGVGNFTLPLARHCDSVTGFEGVPEMVQMAQHNAQLNDITNVSFVSGDLSDTEILAKMTELKCNKVLLDPARGGAFEAIEQLVKMAPEAILYVSCNPATFGRDIAKLLAANYQLIKVSLIDMFPHTAHTEMMGLFTPAKNLRR